MKKFYTTLGATLLVSQVAIAQWNTSTPGKISTTSDDVSIGTTSSTAKLDVRAPVTPGNPVALQNWSWTSDENWGLKLVQSHSGNSIDQKFVQTFSGTAIDVLAFKSGNVGIGTTAPGEKLIVLGSTTSSFNSTAKPIALFAQDATNTRGIYLGFDASGQTGIISSSTGGAPSNTAFWNFNGSYWAEHMRLTSAGYLGIGTSTPSATLDVAGSIQTNRLSTNGDLANIIIRNSNAAATTGDARASIWLDNDGKFKLRSVTGYGIAFRNTSNTADILHINDSGMAIGAALPTGYMLAVNGKVITKEVRVDASWADYVFDDSYKLKSIPEVEAFIKANHHLPDVPSAVDVEKNGVHLGETSSLLLKKIEELTLYLIEKDKQMKDLQTRLNTLEKQLNKDTTLSKN